MEQIVCELQKNLKAAQDKQKCYVDLKRKHKEFWVGDHVYLRFKPKKSSLKRGSCKKLAPRFCWPFQVLERIGPVAYKLALPVHLKIHNVFHVSLLKKYVYDLAHIIDWNVVQVEPKGEFQVEPACILDKKEIVLKNRVITWVKVQWKHFRPEEATWELEDEMWMKYPSLFSEPMGENEHWGQCLK